MTPVKSSAADKPRNKRCKVCRQLKPNTDTNYTRRNNRLAMICIQCAASQPSKPPKPEKPPRQLSEAQKHVGMDSNPDQASKKEKIKLCIVDHEKDEMYFVEGVVTQRGPTHADQLLPGGFEILLTIGCEKGYRVFERGTRFNGVISHD